jgi:hypothetical protein
LDVWNVGLLEASSGLWKEPSPSLLVVNPAVVLVVAAAAAVEMMRIPEGFACLKEEHSRLPSIPRISEAAEQVV